MDNKKMLIITIVACIVVFFLGLSLGLVYRPQKTINNVVSEPLKSNMASKVISSISAYGQVTNIQDRSITVANLGDNLVVPMASSAQVFAFKVPLSSQIRAKAALPVQQTVDFKDIKIGDKINAILKLSSDGQVQGLSVIILPANK